MLMQNDSTDKISPQSHFIILPVADSNLQVYLPTLPT